MSKKNIGRFCSMLLAVVLMVNLFCMSFGLYAVAVYSPSPITDAQIIANNYGFLNEKEIVVLGCTALVGDSHEVTYPADSDAGKLITIDAANKKVTAANYEKNGNLWKAVSGKVVYQDSTGTEQFNSFTLTDGVGTFSCSSDTYSIEIEYELSISVDAAKQVLLVNAPAYLANGIINMNYVNDCLPQLATIANNIDLLHEVTNGDGIEVDGFKVTVPVEDETKAAIRNLHDECKENGGSFLLSSLMASYETNRASGKAVSFLLSNGTAVKSSLQGIRGDLATVAASEKLDAITKGMFKDADQIKTLKTALETLQKLVEKMNKVTDANWAILDNPVVKENASETEMAALSAAVLATISEAGAGFTTEASLHTIDTPASSFKVATKKLTIGHNQHKLTVIVKAEVAGIDPAANITLSEISTKTFNLDENATKADMMAAIATSKIVSDAISLWDAKYEIGTEHYDVKYDGLTDKLTSDITCTITYVPKTVTLTYEYATGEPTKVPYGFTMVLPKYPDDTKSYIYKIDGTSYRETTTYRVTKDVTIVRETGDPLKEVAVTTVIANSANAGGLLNTQEKNVLLSGALITDSLWFNTPDQSLNLVKVKGNGGAGYIVEATNHSSGLPSGTEWKATSYKAISGDAVVSSGSLTNGKAEFEYSGSIDYVTVVYTLAVDDVAKETIQSVLNLPNTLATEANQQKQTMDSLYNDLYDGLARLDNSMLGQVSTAALRYSEEAQAAVRMLMNNAIDKSTTEQKLYLYNYLTSYKAQGLAFYYAGENATKISAQVELLKTNLNILWADAVFQDDLANNDQIKGYAGRLEEVKNKINEVSLAPVNSAINTNSDKLSVLAAALVEAIDNTSTHTFADSKIGLTTELLGAAPDKASVTIVVNVLDGKGGIASTTSSNIIFSSDIPLTAADISGLNSLVASLNASADANHYTQTVSGTIPAVGTTLGSDVVVTYTWTPVTYTVKLDGVTIKTFTAADSEFVITLPLCAIPNTQYLYTIGSEQVTVGTADKEYRFKDLAAVDAASDDTRTILVTRSSVDVYTEEIVKLTQSLNKAVADKGFVVYRDGRPELMFAFIPMEDSMGNQTIVLRVSPAGSPTNYQDLLTAIAEVITTTYFNYIGMNDEIFWDGQIHLQTFFDTLFASNFGMTAVEKMIDSNGKIRSITVDRPALASMSVLGASGGKIAVNGSAEVGHFMLGGELLATTLQLGSSAEDFRNVSFYVTMEDFGRSPEELKKLDGVLQKVNNYFCVDCGNDMLNITVNDASDKLYPVFLSGMLVLGYTDLSDVSEMDLADCIDYVLSVVESLVNDPDFSLATIENTLDKIGKPKDLSQYEKYFNIAVKLLKEFFNNVDLQADSVGNVYSGKVSYGNLASVLKNKFGISDMLLSFIYEASTEGADINFDFAVTVKNLETAYDALVINPTASVTKILCSSKDLAKTLNAAGNNTIVVLLQDVVLNDTIEASGNVFIDLNGFNLTGDIQSSGNVRIADSSLDTKNCGTVSGTLTGNFTLVGGKYTADVSAMLGKGYVQDADGTVHNQLYVMKQDANGNVTVFIGNGGLNKNAIPSLKTLATDLVIDMLVNYYTTAALTVDGNVIYNVDVADLIFYLGQSKSSALNAVLDCLDLGGISATVNSILADLTDFAALQTAIENGDILASYQVTTNAWQLNAGIAGTSKKYVTVGVGSSDRVISDRTWSVALDESMSAEDKQLLADLCGNVAKILSIDEMNFNATKLVYENGKLVVDGKAVFDATVDVSADPRYAVVIAASVASVSSGDYKTELVDAIKAYLTTKSTKELKTALDKMTTAQAVSAFKKLNSTKFDTLLASLGIEASAEYGALTAVYGPVFEAVTAVINYFGITGGGTTLGSQAVNSEFGLYSFEKKNWHKCDVTLALKLLNEQEPVSEITINTPVVTLNASVKGYSVDVANARIFLDVAPAGVKGSQFKGFVTFTAENADSVAVSLTRSETELVCNGDTVTVTAMNSVGGSATVTYTVIIMGDTNGNGETDAGDAVLMAKHYTGKVKLSDIALLAADMNQNGELDAGDAVKNAKKFNGWDKGSYNSLLK